MSLYLVTSGERRLWVAYEDGQAGQLHVYVANTGRFHRNRALTVDFFVDQEYTYEPVDVAQAQAAMRDGVGKLDERIKAGQVARSRADSASLTTADVLRRSGD